MLEKLSRVYSDEEEYNLLIDLIKTQKIACSNINEVNGDYRFWNVDKGTSPILRDFFDLTISKYYELNKKNPKHIYLMINHIDAKRTRNGSGNGWHVDSVKYQYKSFMYLTDCLSLDQGPLTFLKNSKEWKERIVIILNYLRGNGLRFKDEYIDSLMSRGFEAEAHLCEKLLPIYADTSLVHRGSPITQGERIMVTAYMYQDNIPPSIQKRLMAWT